MQNIYGNGVGKKCCQSLIYRACNSNESRKKNPRKKVPQKNGPWKLEFKNFYLTHKNVTVIFASKYRRILLIENVEFWVFIDYVILT